MTKQKIITVSLAVVFVLILVQIGLWIYEQSYAKNQEIIQATPMDLVIVLQDAGYHISSIEEWDLDDVDGRFGDVEAFITIDINGYHGIFFSYSSWEVARSAAKIKNELDLELYGKQGSAFHYGPVVVFIHPSDKEFGSELLNVLREND